MKEIIDFNFPWSFQPIWTCFGNIIRKKNPFSTFVFTNMFLLSLWNLNKLWNLLPNHQSFLCWAPDMFLQASLLRKYLRTRLLTKQTESSMPWGVGHLFSGWYQKVTSDLAQFFNNHGLKRGREYINLWDLFHIFSRKLQL